MCVCQFRFWTQDVEGFRGQVRVLPVLTCVACNWVADIHLRWSDTLLFIFKNALYICGGQRAAFKNWLSLSSVYVTDTKLVGHQAGRKWLHLLSYLRPSSGDFFIDTSQCLIWSPCSPSHVRHNTQSISCHHFNFTWGFCLGEFCICLVGFYPFTSHLPKWVFILLPEEYSQPMYWLLSLGFQSQISYSPEVLECSLLRISYRPSLVRAHTGEAAIYPV